MLDTYDDMHELEWEHIEMIVQNEDDQSYSCTCSCGWESENWDSTKEAKDSWDSHWENVFVESTLLDNEEDIDP